MNFPVHIPREQTLHLETRQHAESRSGVTPIDFHPLGHFNLALKRELGGGGAILNTNIANDHITGRGVVGGGVGVSSGQGLGRNTVELADLAIPRHPKRLNGGRKTWIGNPGDSTRLTIELRHGGRGRSAGIANGNAENRNGVGSRVIRLDGNLAGMHSIETIAAARSAAPIGEPYRRATAEGAEGVAAVIEPEGVG